MVEPTKKVDYYKDGNIRCEEYWLNSKEFTKEEFLVSKEYQNYLADLEIERILDEE